MYRCCSELLSLKGHFRVIVINALLRVFADSVICSLWFHAVILDIFRPFTQEPEHVRRRCLRTFSGRVTTASDVCNASVVQLRHLITEYRLHYMAPRPTLLWQTALIYVVNAALNANPDRVNTDPYGAGWLMRLKPASAGALAGMLSAAEYTAGLAAEGG